MHRRSHRVAPACDDQVLPAPMPRPEPESGGVMIEQFRPERGRCTDGRTGGCISLRQRTQHQGAWPSSRPNSQATNRSTDDGSLQTLLVFRAWIWNARQMSMQDNSPLAFFGGMHAAFADVMTSQHNLVENLLSLAFGSFEGNVGHSGEGQPEHRLAPRLAPPAALRVVATAPEVFVIAGYIAPGEQRCANAASTAHSGWPRQMPTRVD